MYLRSLRRSASEKPSTSSRRLRNAALSDSLSRMRITASSPWIDGMIETRKSIVRPLHAQPEASVLRHALLGDVQLGHHLDPADDRVVVALVERLDRRVAARRRCGTSRAPRGPWSRCGCRRRAGRSRPSDQRVHQPHDRALARQSSPRSRRSRRRTRAAAAGTRWPARAASRRRDGAAAGPRRAPAARPRLDRPPSRNSSSSTLGVLERRRRRARSGAPSRPHRHAGVAHQQLERRPRTRARGRPGCPRAAPAGGRASASPRPSAEMLTRGLARAAGPSARASRSRRARARRARAAGVPRSPASPSAAGPSGFGPRTRSSGRP